MSKGELGAALYRAMRDGDDARFEALVARYRGALDGPAGGPASLVLISAVLSERSDYLERLLDAGADADQRNLAGEGSSYNMRALDVAHWFERGDMIAILRRAGSQPDFGTAVFARDVPAVAGALAGDPGLRDEAYIHAHFNLVHVAADVSSAALVRLFVDAGLDPDHEDADGHAPLRYAARNAPALDVLAALVAAGADVNHMSRTGITALSAACRHAESLPTVRWLLEHGADPNLVPKNRVSPLMKAAANRVPEMARLLVEHGADVRYRGKNDETALEVAFRRNAPAVAAILRGAR